MKQVHTAITIILMSLNGLAQPEGRPGNWTGFNSRITLEDHWAIFVQGEYRTWEFLANTNELLWRLSGQYSWKNQMVAAGYVRVDTWPYTGESFRKFYENRFYQEYFFKLKLGHALNDHRFRLEQRWLSYPEEGTHLSHRIRYNIGFTMPVRRADVETRFFLRVFNEVFMDLDKFDYWFNREGDKAGLNQIRLYGGLGYKFKRPSSFQAGFLWQHRPTSDFWRIVLSYTHNFE